MVDGRPEFGVMATGQVAGLIDDLPTCAELIGRIVAQAEAILAGFAARSSAPGEDVQDDGSQTGAEGERQ